MIRYEWREYQDKKGRLYYHNSERDETTWKKPRNFPGAAIIYHKGKCIRVEPHQAAALLARQQSSGMETPPPRPAGRKPAGSGASPTITPEAAPFGDLQPEMPPRASALRVVQDTADTPPPRPPKKFPAEVCLFLFFLYIYIFFCKYRHTFWCPLPGLKPSPVVFLLWATVSF